MAAQARIATYSVGIVANMANIEKARRQKCSFSLVHTATLMVISLVAVRECVTAKQQARP